MTAPLSTPRFQFEVAWGKDPLDTPGAGDWIDETSRLRSFEGSRGRSFELDSFQAGEFSFVLANQDRRLEPGYTGSPLSPNVIPRRRCRLTAYHDELIRDALVFDGSTGDVAEKTAFAGWPTTAFTFESWVTGEGAASGDNSAETPLSYYSGANHFYARDLRSLTICVANNNEINTGVDVIGDKSGPVHLAVTWRSSDGFLCVFVDGALRYAGIYTASIGDSMAGGGTVWLGQRHTGGGTNAGAVAALNGSLHEVRIWNIARTQHAVHADMFRDLVGTETGLVSYWRTDEGTGTTVEDDAGANDLTMSGATWGSTEGRRVRFTGFIESIEPVWPDPSKSDAYVVIRATDAVAMLAQFLPPISAYRATVLSQSPYLYWPLDDEGSRAKDVSGNGRHGTVNLSVRQGSEAPVPRGDTGRAVRFVNGAKITAADNTIANFERTDSFSFSFLFRWEGDPLTGSIVRVLMKQGTNSRYEWGIVSIGMSLLLDAVTASQTLDVDGLRLILDGHWHHLATTYAGTSAPAGVGLYVDGELLGTTTDVNTLASTILPNTGILTLQAQGAQATYQGGHLGIWDRALTAAEVKAQYEAAFHPFASQRADVRVDLILDAMGWPASERDLRRAVATIGPAIDPFGNALEHLHTLAALEVSGLYADVFGRVVFDDRYANGYDSPIAWTVSDERIEGQVSYTTISMRSDEIDLGTEVHTQTTPDGSEFIATDAAAETKFAPRTVALAGPWSDDNQSRELGEKLLARVTSLTRRFTKVVFPAGPQTWAPILTARLHRDRVQVTHHPIADDPAPISQVCWVEKTTESWHADTGAYFVEWELAPDEGTRSDLFLVGRSPLDGTAVLA